MKGKTQETAELIQEMISKNLSRNDMKVAMLADIAISLAIIADNITKGEDHD